MRNNFRLFFFLLFTKLACKKHRLLYKIFSCWNWKDTRQGLHAPIHLINYIPGNAQTWTWAHNLQSPSSLLPKPTLWWAAKYARGTSLRANAFPSPCRSNSILKSFLFTFRCCDHPSKYCVYMGKAFTDLSLTSNTMFSKRTLWLIPNREPGFPTCCELSSAEPGRYHCLTPSAQYSLCPEKNNNWDDIGSLYKLTIDR